jgi:hypothetical protein
MELTVAFWLVVQGRRLSRATCDGDYFTSLLLFTVMVPVLWVLQKRGGRCPGGQMHAWPLRIMILVGLFATLISGLAVRQYAQVTGPTAAAPFEAFAPKVRTRFDGQYLYVESDGLPSTS